MEEDKKLTSNSSHSSSDMANPNGENVNTGRWTDAEHRRFLEGLEQYGTGNWKKITERVGTRSCTQIRTHAQKYFIALQKPPNVGGKSGLTSSSRKAAGGMKSGKRKDDAPHRKKSKLKNGGSVADMSSSALYGAPTPVIRKQRGLTGIEVLAQAAETENDYDTLEQTVDHYNQPHHRSRKRKSGAVSDDGSEHESSSDDDDDEESGSNEEEEDDEDEDDDDVEEQQGSSEKKQKATPSNAYSNSISRSTPPNSMEYGKESERDAALALIESSIGRRPIHSASGGAISNDENEKLRHQVEAANHMILKLQQQSHEAELKAAAAIDDKARAMAEIKALQEINAQLKTEHRRAMVMLEHSTGAAARNHLAQLESRMGMGSNSSAIMAAAAAHGLSPAAAAAMAQQHQQASSLQQQHHQHQNHAHIIDLLQNQLTEAELRFHQVTESLTRQTGVLTDQHRAILELNSKLEKEKAKRRSVEMELSRLRGSG